MNTPDKIINLSFYTVLLMICGLGEYFHLVPMGSLALVIGGILGHGISTNSLILGNSMPNNTQVESEKK